MSEQSDQRTDGEDDWLAAAFYNEDDGRILQFLRVRRSVLALHPNIEAMFQALAEACTHHLNELRKQNAEREGAQPMRRLIRTDGTELELPEPLTIDQIAKLIGATTMDSVTLWHLGEPQRSMMVDDNGWETEHIDLGGGMQELRPVRALKPINAKATALYLANCEPGTTHQIAGDVVIVPEDDFGDGDNLGDEATR